MARPKLERWSLVDQHGPWCAWCLRYFPAALTEGDHWVAPPAEIPKTEHRERHHPVQKARLPEILDRTLGAQRSAFSSSKFPRSWTVDAHGRCHRLEVYDVNLQNLADAATARLKLLTSDITLRWDAPEAAFQKFDSHVVEAFETGLYSIAVFLNEFVRAARWRRDERDLAFETLEHQISALAGVHGQRPLKLSAFGDGQAMHRTRAVLYHANHQSNAGYMAAARASLDHAQAMLQECEQTQRDELELDLLLRRAQITRSRDAAERALALATSAGTAYRQNTARVFAGTIALAEGSHASREHFDAVLASGEGASWLYRAESWFGRGCLALESSRIAEAYRYLIAAQYVYAVLRLQPMPHPDLRLSAATRTDCMPIDLLREPRFLKLSAGQCEELRIQAIAASDLRVSIFKDLAGWPGSGVLPDPLRT